MVAQLKRVCSKMILGNSFNLSNILKNKKNSSVKKRVVFFKIIIKRTVTHTGNENFSFISFY